MMLTWGLLGQIINDIENYLADRFDNSFISVSQTMIDHIKDMLDEVINKTKIKDQLPRDHMNREHSVRLEQMKQLEGEAQDLRNKIENIDNRLKDLWIYSKY